MKMLPDSGLPGMPLWDPPVPVWTGFILSTTNENLPPCDPRVPLCTGGLASGYFCPSSQQMKFTPQKTQRFTTAYIICIPNQNIMHGNQ